MFRWRARRAPRLCWLEALRRPRTGAPEGRPAPTTKLAWRGTVNPTRQGGKGGRQEPRGRRMPALCESCCRMMRSVVVFVFVRLGPANASRLTLSCSRLLTPTTRAGHRVHLWFGTRHVNRISGLTSCTHDARLAATFTMMIDDWWFTIVPNIDGRSSSGSARTAASLFRSLS
jgi:hypothetical protein